MPANVEAYLQAVYEIVTFQAFSKILRSIIPDKFADYIQVFDPTIVFAVSALILIAILILFLKLLNIPRCLRVKTMIQNKFQYSFPIRFMLESYLKMTVALLLSLYSLSFETGF